MNKKIFFFVLSIISCLFFVNCKNIEAGIYSDKAIVHFSVESSSARAVIGDSSITTSRPDEYAKTDFKYELTYCKNQDWENAEILNCENYTELSDLAIELEKGTWSFKIEALINWEDETGVTSDEIIAEAQVLNKQITGNENISFDLELKSDSEKKGFLRLSIYYSDEYCNDCTLNFYDISGMELTELRQTTSPNPISSPVTLEKYLKPGTYIIKISFSYNNKIVSKIVFAKILANHKTQITKNYGTIFSNYNVYKINYLDLNGLAYSGSTIADSEKYIAENEKLTLPSPTKTSIGTNTFVFDGWYVFDSQIMEYKNLTNTVLDGASVSEDLTLYAKWNSKFVYLDCDEGDDANDGFSPVTAVKTVSAAKKRLNNSRSEAIYVMSSISSTEDINELSNITSLEYNNTCIKRYENYTTGSLIYVDSDCSIENLVIDGNSVASTSCAIYHNSGSLNLNSVEIQNNSALSCGGIITRSNLSLNDVVFTSNENYDIQLYPNNNPISFETNDYSKKIKLDIATYPDDVSDVAVLKFRSTDNNDYRKNVISVFELNPAPDSTVYEIGLDGHLINPNISGGGSIILPENKNFIFKASESEFTVPEASKLVTITAYEDSLSNNITDDISSWSIKVYSGGKDISSEFTISDNKVTFPAHIAPGTYQLVINVEYDLLNYVSSIYIFVDLDSSSGNETSEENEFNFSELNYLSSDESEFIALLTDIKNKGYDSITLKITGEESFYDDNQTLAGMMRCIGSQGIKTTRLNLAFADSSKCTVLMNSLAGSDGSSSKLILDFKNSNITDFGETINFKYRNNISEVILPDNLEKIPQQFLAGARGMDSITIPASVKEIGIMAFQNSEFNEIIFEDSLSVWSVYLDMVDLPSNDNVTVSDKELNVENFSITYANCKWVKNND